MLIQPILGKGPEPTKPSHQVNLVNNGVSGKIRSPQRLPRVQGTGGNVQKTTVISTREMVIDVTDGMMIEAGTGIGIGIVIGTTGIRSSGERDHIRDLCHPGRHSHPTGFRGAQGVLSARISEGGETDGRAYH